MDKCKKHPEREVDEMWPWTKRDMLCIDCIYDAQANAERLSEKDRINQPVQSFCMGTHYDAGDRFLYDSRGRSPGSPETKV